MRNNPTLILYQSRDIFKLLKFDQNIFWLNVVFKILIITRNRRFCASNEMSLIWRANDFFNLSSIWSLKSRKHPYDGEWIPTRRPLILFWSKILRWIFGLARQVEDISSTPWRADEDGYKMTLKKVWVCYSFICSGFWCFWWIWSNFRQKGSL